jgi:hypothetical protein
MASVFLISNVTANITSSTIIKNQKLIKSMLLNMRFVSFMCNFWTIILSLLMILEIGKKLMLLRSDSSLTDFEKKLKKKLYISTMLFATLIFV